MANFALYYDLNLEHMDANGSSKSTVQDFVESHLQQKGLSRHQDGCWHADNVPAVEFHATVTEFANTVEAKFGSGVFQSLKYCQRFHSFVVR